MNLHFLSCSQTTSGSRSEENNCSSAARCVQLSECEEKQKAKTVFTVIGQKQTFLLQKNVYIYLTLSLFFWMEKLQ